MITLNMYRINYTVHVPVKPYYVNFINVIINDYH